MFFYLSFTILASLVTSLSSDLQDSEDRFFLGKDVVRSIVKQYFYEGLTGLCCNIVRNRCSAGCFNKDCDLKCSASCGLLIPRSCGPYTCRDIRCETRNEETCTCLSTIFYVFFFISFSCKENPPSSSSSSSSSSSPPTTSATTTEAEDYYYYYYYDSTTPSTSDYYYYY